MSGSCGSHAVREVDEKTGKEDVDRRCTGGLICSGNCRQWSGCAISCRVSPSISRSIGGVYIETLHEKGLFKEPADIFRLAKKLDALEQGALAERRAEQAAERRAQRRQRRSQKNPKRTTMRTSKLAANLIASIEARPQNRDGPLHQRAWHSSCGRDECAADRAQLFRVSKPLSKRWKGEKRG